MADDFTMKFTGMEELQTRLDSVRAKYPFKEEEILVKLGNVLKARAKEKTPIGRNKKHLKSQYKLSKVNYEKDGTNITMTNTSPLFHLVENGHKITKTKNGPELGFVPGQHMVEASLMELDKEIPSIVGDWLDEVLGGVK